MHKIKIHSFVDLITNSSSEIFVRADSGTVDAMKEIINGILKLGGSTAKSDDFFNISLDDDSLIIVPKNDSKEARFIADHLKNPNGLFEIDAEYNG